MKNITVIGAGTMGNGIAHVFAQSGYQVILCDINEEALKKAMHTIDSNLDRLVQKDKLTEKEKTATIARLSSDTSLHNACKSADLVVEAVSENEQIKLKLFQQMDAAAPAHCILASNTSSISITKIASATARPDKVIGMHFMNPVPIMKLVEIINGYSTSKETTELVVKTSKSLDKIPVSVEDYPGFIANRILMPMINEAIIALQEGVAGVAEIDSIMKLGMAHPMGPLLLADFIGLDVCKSIMDVLHQGLGNPKYAPSPLLVNMVLAGKLGRKSGEGFYKYTLGSKDIAVADRFTL